MTSSQLTIDEVNEDSVYDLESRAITGRFGASDLIWARARPWYVGVGVPREVVAAQALHPMAEYLAERRGRGLEDDQRVDASIALLPCPESPTERVRGWLDFSAHRADAPLLAMVSRRLLRSNDSQAQCNPISIERITRGLEYVAQPIPRLVGDALSHVRRIYLSDVDEIVGQTWTDTVGLICLGATTPHDPLTCGDSLLHEALHSKAEHVARGLTTPFVDETQDCANISIPWRKAPSGYSTWTTLRALDACYVYSHLCILYAGLYVLSPTRLTRVLLRQVSFRAEYLSIRAKRGKPALIDEDRAALLAWLRLMTIAPFDLSDFGRRSLAYDPT